MKNILSQGKEAYIWLFFCLSVIISALILALHYIPNIVCAWDEAEFIKRTISIYQPLTQGNITEILKSIKSLYTYPPLQEVILSFLLLPLGISVTNIRIAGLIFFVGIPFLLILYARKYFGKNFTIIAATSVFLFLTSPLMIYFGGIVMKEMPSTFFTLLTIYSYVKARKTHSYIVCIVTGIFLFLLTMTKYNYGGIVVLAIGFEAFLSMIFYKEKKRLFFQNALLFGVFIVCFGSWFAVQGSRLWIDYFSLDRSFGPTMEALKDWKTVWFFYPISIIYTYTFSRILGYLLILGLALSILYIKKIEIRINVITVFIAIIFQNLFLPNNLQERYILPSIPLLFLITPYAYVNYIGGLIQINRIFRPFFICIGLIITILLINDLRTINEYVYKVSSYTGKHNAFNLEDYDDSKLWFNNNPQDWPNKFNSHRNKPADVYSFIYSHVDAKKPVYFEGRANEFAPPLDDVLTYINSKKNTSVTTGFDSYYATIEILPGSPFYTRDFTLLNSWTMDLVQQKRTDPTLTKIAEKTFEDIGVVAQVFGK